MKRSDRHNRFSYGQVLSLAVTAVVLFLFQSVAVPGFFVAGSGTISELQAARQDLRTAIKAQDAARHEQISKSPHYSIFYCEPSCTLPVPSLFFSIPVHQNQTAVAAVIPRIPARSPPV